jgi:SAM-dependent methyltransferase
MEDRETSGKAARQHSDNARRYKRDFWATENRGFAEPHFRLQKVAGIVRDMVGDKECDLLDLGCGPSTFARLMPPNVRYYGIDIAIHDPAPNLIEKDLLETPIDFRGMKFDLVLAQGLFEYLGDRQRQKFAEIRTLLKDSGKFVVTYINFAHRQRNLYHAYSNVQEPGAFRRDLERYFTIDRAFPGAYNWNHTLPSRRFMKKAQSRLYVNIPFVSEILAVDYFYICSPRPSVKE